MSDPAAPPVRILIDGKPFEVQPGNYGIRDLKRLASIQGVDALGQDVDGNVAQLDDSATVTIVGGEVFLSFPTKVEITINGKKHEVARGKESVTALKKLGHVPDADQLDQDINGVMTVLDQHGSVAISGGEIFLSFPAIVKITVDGNIFEIGRGKEPVATIKKVASVPAANQLDQDIHGVLTPLDQNGSVVIRGGEIFVSYPATGSSS